MKRKLILVVYYAFAQHLPTQPVPGWRFGYWFRRALCRRLFMACGDDVVVKKNCYFGTGSRLRVGNGSQLGANSRIDNDVTIGSNVMMGPEVVMMTASHAFDRLDVPIIDQGARPTEPITVGDGVWLGTRVVILPGVSIGEGAIVGAGSVVTRDVPPFSIVAGNPARRIRDRQA